MIIDETNKKLATAIGELLGLDLIHTKGFVLTARAGEIPTIKIEQFCFDIHETEFTTKFIVLDNKP